MATAPKNTEEFKFPDETELNSGDDDKGGTKVTAGDETEVEVEVVDDTPEKDRNRKPLEREVADPTDDELDTYTEGVKKRIAELTHARHDERRRAEALERERQELARITEQLLQENNALKQNVTTGRDVLVNTFKERAQADLERARADLKAAHEAFDTEKIVAAQEAMQDAKLRLDKAANFRPPPLQEAKRDVQTPQARQPEVKPDEKALRWQARNQWFGDPEHQEVTSFALGLHQKLVRDGLDVRSDEYYEQLDARVKSRFPELFEGREDNKPTSGAAPRKPASVVAPSSRSTGPRKIQLTTTQVALAKRLGLTPQQYAAQVAKLENQNG